MLVQGNPKEVTVQLTSDELCVICMFVYRVPAVLMTILQVVLSSPVNRSCNWMRSLLNTAEYCLQTIGQLEEKLKEKIDPVFREQVVFTEEHDHFVDVCDSAE